MVIDQIIATIKHDFKTYHALGLVDDLLIYREAFWALKRFGNLISSYQESVVEIINGQGVLPQGFSSLAVAYKCDPYGYEMEDLPEVTRPIKQVEIGYVQKTEHGYRWNSCNECCKDEVEVCVTETLYLNQSEAKVRFHYQNPKPLHAGSTFVKDPCYAKYRKQFMIGSDSEINMDQAGNIYAPFKSGFIYMIYKGTPLDKDGKPFAPESQLGFVEKYTIAACKRAVLEDIASNGQMDVGNLLQYWAQKEADYFDSACIELKMNGINPYSYSAMNAEYQRRVEVRDQMMPRVIGKEVKIIHS